MVRILDQKMRAIRHLIALWQTTRTLQHETNQNNDNRIAANSTISNHDNVSNIELLLRQKESELQMTTAIDEDNIEKKLREYALLKRSSLSQHAIQYWSDRKSLHKELYKLSMITNSVPITQVSVERAFSSLAFILSPLRNSLGEDTLENILIIRLNKDVFIKIPSLILEDEGN